MSCIIQNWRYLVKSLIKIQLFFLAITIGHSHDAVAVISEEQVQKTEKAQREARQSLKDQKISHTDYLQEQQGIQKELVRNTRLDQETVDKINEKYPFWNVQSGMSIDEALEALAKTSITPQEQAQIASELFSKNLLSRDINEDLGETLPGFFTSNNYPKIMEELIKEAQDHVKYEKMLAEDEQQKKIAQQQAQEELLEQAATQKAEATTHKEAVKQGKLARKNSKNKDIIDDFLQEPIGKFGNTEYHLKYFRGSEHPLSPNKTTVDNVLRQVIFNSKNPEYIQTPNDRPAETIIRNMSAHLGETDQLKYQKYFGGKKPKITEEIINRRLAELQQESKQSTQAEQEHFER